MWSATSEPSIRSWACQRIARPATISQGWLKLEDSLQVGPTVMVRTIRQVTMLAKLPENAWIVKFRNENCRIAGGIPALQWCTTVGLELRHRCKGSSGSKPPKTVVSNSWDYSWDVWEFEVWSEIRLATQRSFRITSATSTVLRDEAFTPHADGRPDGWAFVGDAVSWDAICNSWRFLCWEKAPVDQRWFHSGWWINPPGMARTLFFWARDFIWDGYINWSH